MEKWEHMSVHAIERTGDSWQLWTVGAPGFTRRGVDPLSTDPSVIAPMELLGSLGEEGWELVDTDERSVGTGLTRYSFYLKRRRT